MDGQAQNLKELYEKDFYLWVQGTLKLLKNREYLLVGWENLVEEIEDMGIMCQSKPSNRPSWCTHDTLILFTEPPVNK